MKSELKAKFLTHLLKNKKNDEGFTLIELLVVIIIIGILSAIALPSFLNQANKARESEAAGNIGAVNRAQQAFFVENNRFGSNLDVLDLGIGNTKNYTYSATTAGSALAAVATSTAVGAGQLKSYAGRVWLEASPGGSVSKSVVCAGAAGAGAPTPTSTTTCP